MDDAVPQEQCCGRQRRGAEGVCELLIWGKKAR